MTKPVAIIVGAGRGVGAATARRLGSAGYDIGLIARRAEPVEELAKELDGLGEDVNVGWGTADAGDAAGLEALIGRMTAHTGRLDVLVYNAVAPRLAPAHELTADDLLADLAVGAAGLLTAVRAALPTFREQRTGTVLATGGRAADHPHAGMGSLGAQKAALRSLVQALAMSLRPEGIHVATVTVNGSIEPGTACSPERIADVYAELVEETAGDPGSWRGVVELNG